MLWKLLRSHVSLPQFAGFLLANLVGMAIVLTGVQVYHDVAPLFTQEDSFMRAQHLIVSKRIGMGNTLGGQSRGFSDADIADLTNQPYVKRVGAFTPAEYKIDATLSIGGQVVMNSELPLECVPDEFIDIDAAEWQWKEGDREVPIIMPRSYIAMYNFGFAQKRGLPKVSESLVSQFDIVLYLHGNGEEATMRGRIIGFSGRINSILVPQAFISWSNSQFASGKPQQPSRLMVDLSNAAAPELTAYLEDHSCEIEDERLAAEKTTWFLRLIVTGVTAIGALISVLSIYILMLSIFLLVEKNVEKLQNLRLIGYSTAQTARPYQVLTALLNLGVLVVAVSGVALLRSWYMPLVAQLYPQMPDTTLLPTICCGTVICLLVTAFNFVAVYRRVRHTLS